MTTTNLQRRDFRAVLGDVLDLVDEARPSWTTIANRITRSGVPTAFQTSEAVREKLTTIEAELSSARERRAVAARERDATRTAFADAPSLSTKSVEFKTAANAVAALGHIDDEIADLQAAQVGTLKMLGRGAGHADHRSNSAPAGPAGTWQTGQILKDDSTRGRLQAMASTTMPVGRLALGQVADRDDFKADVSGTDNMRRGEFAGIVPQLRRQLRILDLIPTGTMEMNTLPYTEESGSFSTAAETAEGAIKPEAQVVFTDATAEAVTIAHWTKLRKQSLADTSALQSVIDGRLRYGVETRLQDAILAGDGIGDHMRGILATTGIQVVDYIADALVADQILTGITGIFLANAEADAVLVHPLDWAAVLSAKATGDGHYFSGGPFQVTPQVIWGIPLIPSAAIAQGTALVGDFSIGAQVFIREGVHVLLSDSDQDDFIRNRVTLLAEMRAALAVFRPSAFATVALA